MADRAGAERFARWAVPKARWMAERSGAQDPEDAAQIAALYVHQSRRREGLGRGLLQIAVGDLIGRGFERLIIGCLDTNTPGLRFYEHLGGVVVGHVEDEEYGFSSTQVLFGWPDISTLAT